MGASEKISRRESEAPGEEGEEVKSARRKAIRVVSKETQDYMREANDMNQEDAEEISFVPSGIIVPQKSLFRCDIQCSEKTVSFWQFVSVVIKESEDSYTTNVCQQCYNEFLEAKRRQTIDAVAVVRSRGEKGASWKAMEVMGK